MIARIIKDKKLFLLIAAVSPLVLTACGTIPIGRYNPKPSMAKGVVEKVSFSCDVALLNDQPSTEDHFILFKDTIVNYNKFTQSIVDALKMELERNGVQVKDTSQKVLYIKVTNVDYKLLSSNMRTGRSAKYRADINVEVRTGSGQIEFFEITRASYASPFNLDWFPTKPLDAAFKDIVREITENRQINEYFNN